MHIRELDIAIVDALSINPRASWAQVAGTVDSDPSTVARRWQVLTDEGLAWASCTRGSSLWVNGISDHLDIRCLPGHASRLAQVLSEDSRCLTVSTVSGGADLRVLLDVADLRRLDAVMAEPIWRDPAIQSVEHNIALAVQRTAHRWTSGAISPTQQHSMRPHTHTGPAQSATLSGRDRELATLLQEDVRMTVTELGERLGVSTAAASRQLRRLLASQAVELRVEAAPQVTGWPWSVGLYAEVPPAQLAGAGRFAAAMPGSRGALSVAHPRWNLMAIYWMRSPGDLFGLQASLEREIPGLRTVSRQFTLRPYKRMGMVLDADGRASRWVPVTL